MEFLLTGGKQFAFRDARGVYLECTEGMVWLTVEGQPGDFLLARGERLRIESKGLALIQGLPFGSVRLVSEATSSNLRLSRLCLSIEQITLLPLFTRVGG
jgi:hypothetical protein